MKHAETVPNEVLDLHLQVAAGHYLAGECPRVLCPCCGREGGFIRATLKPWMDMGFEGNVQRLGVKVVVQVGRSRHSTWLPALGGVAVSVTPWTSGPPPTGDAPAAGEARP